jgi:hypothetical protein
MEENLRMFEEHRPSKEVPIWLRSQRNRVEQPANDLHPPPDRMVPGVMQVLDRHPPAGWDRHQDPQYSARCQGSHSQLLILAWYASHRGPNLLRGA